MVAQSNCSDYHFNMCWQRCVGRRAIIAQLADVVGKTTRAEVLICC